MPSGAPAIDQAIRSYGAMVGAAPAVVIGGLGAIAVVAVWDWFPALCRVDQLTPHADG